MYHFFIKRARELPRHSIIDFGLLGGMGFFISYRLIKIQQEKNAFIQANPDKKITVKPCPGLFGNSWIWAVEEDKKPPSPGPTPP